MKIIKLRSTFIKTYSLVKLVRKTIVFEKTRLCFDFFTISKTYCLKSSQEMFLICTLLPSSPPDRKSKILNFLFHHVSPQLLVVCKISWNQNVLFEMFNEKGIHKIFCYVYRGWAVTCQRDIFTKKSWKSVFPMFKISVFTSCLRSYWLCIKFVETKVGPFKIYYKRSYKIFCPWHRDWVMSSERRSHLQKLWIFVFAMLFIKYVIFSKSFP